MTELTLCIDDTDITFDVDNGYLLVDSEPTEMTLRPDVKAVKRVFEIWDLYDVQEEDIQKVKTLEDLNKKGSASPSERNMMKCDIIAFACALFY
eukprot:2576568-Amphidinium_carterae.1